VHRHRQSERDASYTPVLKKAADKPAPPNQAIRTIPSGTSSGCHVGWDWAVELLNYAIKQHVAHQVSEIQMRNFVANWALLESVQERLRDLRYQHRAQTNLNHFSDAGPDVARLLEIFRKTVGRTWAVATKPNTVSHVTLGPQRARLPWLEVRGVMRRAGADAPHIFIRRHVSSLTPFFSWRP
jgi:hypothetical protein